jgi:hypothetical protein
VKSIQRRIIPAYWDETKDIVRCNLKTFCPIIRKSNLSWFVEYWKNAACHPCLGYLWHIWSKLCSKLIKGSRNYTNTNSNGCQSMLDDSHSHWLRNRQLIEENPTPRRLNKDATYEYGGSCFNPPINETPRHQGPQRFAEWATLDLITICRHIISSSLMMKTIVSKITRLAYIW